MTIERMIEIFKDRLSWFYPEVLGLEAEAVKNVIENNQINEVKGKVTGQVHFCINRILKQNMSDEEAENVIFSQTSYLVGEYYNLHTHVTGIETVNARTNPHDLGMSVSDSLKNHRNKEYD